MKVLLFNGSSRPTGCTFTALSEVAKILNSEGIETEILQSGNGAFRDCIACGFCAQNNRCVFNDDVVNEWTQKAEKADGFVFGSPVYYAHPSGRILSLMDRMFYSRGSIFAGKPGAVVVSARRAGTTASLDVLAKHLTINQMPLVSSTYWTMVHGNTPDEVRRDAEGLQTMRNLGRNMARLLNAIKAGNEARLKAPETEKGARTNFIR